MIKQLGLFGVALAVSAGAVLPATAADAQRYRGQYDRGYYDRGYYDQGYQGGYSQDYRDGYNRNSRYYDGRDYRRTYKKCSDGTVGTVLGAVAGGLLGRVIDGRGDRAVGTILGAGGGALAGRAIERQGSRDAAYQGRCYR